MHGSNATLGESLFLITKGLGALFRLNRTTAVGRMSKATGLEPHLLKQGIATRKVAAAGQILKSTLLLSPTLTGPSMVAKFKE